MRAFKWFTAPVVPLVLMLVFAVQAMAAPPVTTSEDWTGNIIRSVCSPEHYLVLSGGLTVTSHEAGPTLHTDTSLYVDSTDILSGEDVIWEGTFTDLVNTKTGDHSLLEVRTLTRVSDGMVLETYEHILRVKKGTIVLEEENCILS